MAYGYGYEVGRLRTAGLDPIEQFVGTYRINIYSNGIELMFNVTNRTSMNSLLYDSGPSWNRSSFSPGGNVFQTFRWTEPIKR